MTPHGAIIMAGSMTPRRISASRMPLFLRVRRAARRSDEPRKGIARAKPRRVCMSVVCIEKPSYIGGRTEKCSNSDEPAVRLAPVVRRRRDLERKGVVEGQCSKSDVNTERSSNPQHLRNKKVSEATWDHYPEFLLVVDATPGFERLRECLPRRDVCSHFGVRGVMNLFGFDDCRRRRQRYFRTLICCFFYDEKCGDKEGHGEGEYNVKEEPP
jgi:hypothetical protein